SFHVRENGVLRNATAEEMLALDIHQYDHVRKDKEVAVVHDANINKDLVLLSRAAFEKMMLEAYSAEDRTAYQLYKATSTADPSVKQ
ncbi:MAG TPA: hypothetical protein PK760_13600, partial [Flavobacteriales bacterium]|nr:hypothetical protein [Flavobacteriales bacterium]